MKNSFNINDQGELNIYEDHVFYKGKETEISIERSRIKNSEIVNKSPGPFELIQIVIVNLVVISGYLSYPNKSTILFVLLLILSNTVLYFPIFREKWLKVTYLEAGEKRSAYFKPMGVLNLFSSWGFDTNDCQVIYKMLQK